jgi:hypothetical protein
MGLNKALSAVARIASFTVDRSGTPTDLVDGRQHLARSPRGDQLGRSASFDEPVGILGPDPVTSWSRSGDY